MSENLSVYQEHGYEDREDYLLSLADQYGVDLAFVMALADGLGPNEDFDGLVNMIEDCPSYLLN